MKNILRRPVDEGHWNKLQMLHEAVKCEVERLEKVFLNSEDDIEQLARAVEASTSTACGCEVGPGFKAIPPGAQLQISEDWTVPGSTVRKMRTATAAFVRSLPVGEATMVKFRPLRSPRASPLDLVGRELMAASSLREAFPDKTTEEILANLLVLLWDALFLTACENWTEQQVSNTTPADAMELGMWFNRGQEMGRESLFTGICAMCGVLLHQHHTLSNTCYGPPTPYLVLETAVASRLCLIQRALPQNQPG